MRILIIRPTVQPQEIARQRDKIRLNHLRQLVFHGTEIELARVDQGPVAITCDYDVALAALHVLKKFSDVGEKGFDAVVISCGKDPGLYACRQIANIPVVGQGEASHLMAASLGHKYSIINHGKKGKKGSSYHNVVRNLCFESRLASFRGIGLPILDIQKDFEKTKKMFIDEARKAIQEDGADVIVPGCGLFSSITRDLQKELGVPVIDPAGTALKRAEILAALGLTYSKTAFPFPEDPKKSKGLQ